MLRFHSSHTKHSQSVTHSGKNVKTACLLHVQYFYDYSIRGMSRQWFPGDYVFCPLVKTVVRTHVSGSPPGVKTIESTIYIYISFPSRSGLDRNLLAKVRNSSGKNGSKHCPLISVHGHAACEGINLILESSLTNKIECHACFLTLKGSDPVSLAFEASFSSKKWHTSHLVVGTSWLLCRFSEPAPGVEVSKERNCSRRI